MPSNHNYDSYTPVTAHPGMAAAMYGEIFRKAGSVLNVAAGNTNLADDLRPIAPNTVVTAVDPIYSHSPYNNENYVQGMMQELPFEPESFDMTMCQFGLQHIPPSDVGKSIQEMIRVTRIADGPKDDSKGVILLNPIFRADNLRDELDRRGLTEHSVAGILPHTRSQFPLGVRKNVYPSLWIHKHEALNQEAINNLIDALITSKSIRPRIRSLGEIATRYLRRGTSDL